MRRTQGPATAAWRTHEGGWAESGPERTANGVREREGGVAASDEADPVEDTEAIVSTPRQDLTRRTMIEAGGLLLWFGRRQSIVIFFLVKLHNKMNINKSIFLI